jgi:type IV pilus assembly protein PilM
LARLNEITSTEKLLDIIRKKTVEGAAEEKDGASHVPPAEQSYRKGLGKIAAKRKAATKKNITVGIDIGHEYLRLVKTAKVADITPAFIEQKRVTIPPSLVRSSAEFINFLKAELDSFCGVYGNQKIWAIMSAARVEVRHIRIPKVPKKQLENVVLWTVKKESPFDEKGNVFDFEVLGEVIEQGISKLAVMYYTAPREEIEEAKKLFSRAGWPLTGLTITPFAVQNIFRTRWMPGYEGTAASLFIGNDFSRIDIYSQGNLVMTRGIKAGISSMLESMMESLNERSAGVGAGENTVIDKEEARKILLSLNSEAPPLSEDAFHGLKEEAIWEMILPALERLARQVERTFEHFTVSLGNEKVERIYISGAMNVYRPLADYIGSQLGIASEIFDPLSAQSVCRDDESLYDCISERIAFAPALGIALSDNIYTPNLIFTYKDKEREASVKRINMIIFVAFMATVSLCSGFFLYQLHAIDQREKTVLRMDKQLSRYNPLVNRDIILNSMSLVKQEVSKTKYYSARYLGLAIISELSHLASPDIRLLDVKAKLGNPPEKPKMILPANPEAAKATIGTASPAAQAKPSGEIKEVEIDGFVLGEKKDIDNSLATYIMKLDNSPLFQGIKVQKTSEETYRKKTLLRFTISMKMEGV